MLLSIYKERTQNSVSLNTVETNNRRQFLCSVNQASFMPAFCPKLVLSLPLWISSRLILLALPWLAMAGFDCSFVRFASHLHICTFATESESIISICRMSQRKLFEWHCPGFP